ncbi:MAG: hypothetical protein K2X47_06470 [Bdellovibrionales bacterium]|nr:hypothetical protein [Bdellovibrionales bacterium]
MKKLVLFTLSGAFFVTLNCFAQTSGDTARNSSGGGGIDLPGMCVISTIPPRNIDACIDTKGDVVVSWLPLPNSSVWGADIYECQEVDPNSPSTRSQFTARRLAYVKKVYDPQNPKTRQSFTLDSSDLTVRSETHICMTSVGHFCKRQSISRPVKLHPCE